MSTGAVYISTEDAFPSKRWQQLASSFASRHSHLGLTLEKLSNNLYIEHAATVVSHMHVRFLSQIFNFDSTGFHSRRPGVQAGEVSPPNSPNPPSPNWSNPPPAQDLATFSMSNQNSPHKPNCQKACYSTSLFHQLPLQDKHP